MGIQRVPVLSGGYSDGYSGAFRSSLMGRILPQRAGEEKGGGNHHQREREQPDPAARGDAEQEEPGEHQGSQVLRPDGDRASRPPWSHGPSVVAAGAQPT